MTLADQLGPILRGELRKLAYQRYFLWAPMIVIASTVAPVAALGFALGHAASYCSTHGCASPPVPGPESVLTGFAGAGSPPFGMVAVLAVGAMTMLSELRYRTIASTLLVAPQRRLLIASKATIAAATAGISSAVGVFVAGVIFKTLAQSSGAQVEPFGTGNLVTVAQVGVVGSLLGISGVLLSALILRTTWIMVVVIAWPLILELVLPMPFGDLGERVGALLPLVNIKRWLGIDSDALFSWPPATSMAIFVGWVFAVGFVGVLRFTRARIGPAT